MKYKLIKLDKNDKVTFTKEELENLLDEIYEEGRKDGYQSLFYPSTIAIPSEEEIVAPVEQIDWDNVFTKEEENELKAQ